MHLKSTYCCCFLDLLVEQPSCWGPSLSGPLPTSCVCFCFFCPGFSGTALVLLCSRLLLVLAQPLCGLLFCPGFSGTPICFFGIRFLWVTPHPLSAFAFLSWLLWDSFYCLRVPDSLGPLHTLCALLFCAGFSGTAFVMLGSRLLWDPPSLLCAFVFC